MPIATMPRIQIGATAVSRLALGGAGWSLADVPDTDAAVATIHAAIDNGVTLIDTARAYTTLDHPSHNEWLINRALRSHLGGVGVFVATKGGHFRSGPDQFPVDGSPAALRRDCEQSLRFLDRDALDLFALHHPDPSIAIEDSVAELAALRAEGKIRHIGLCNVTTAELTRASRITAVDTVQNRYSPLARDDEMLRHCAQEGIAFLAYSPLGGSTGVQTLGAKVPALNRIAERRDLTVQQVVIAWLLALSPNMVPIVGTGRPAHLVEAAEAAAVRLTPEEISVLAA